MPRKYSLGVARAESLVNLLYQQARITPDNVVVVSEAQDSSVTEIKMKQLDELTDKLAKTLISQYDCKKGSVIVLFMEKCPAYVLSYIAALKAGLLKFISYLILPEVVIQNLFKAVRICHWTSVTQLI